ncbi:UNKNOWN [Stylonychia lemnae]|uniref:Tim10-like domain-containing protein n=1 Tax=Stylonychia lemnae TaxID=5949 RepID=A0A078B5Z3_STYLE|nr:UNKNOWN [Stylonychia lemnae]|eukprot:CDW88737.1 UNKNOWN [Stylonychia lemnae]
MGQALACCNGAQEFFEFTPQTRKIYFSSNVLQSNRKIVQTIDTQTDYNQSGARAVFISKEALPGVEDNYIMKQQKTMRRVQQNRSMSNINGPGNQDASRNYQNSLMNQEDKLKYIEQVEKHMTTFCFNTCFNKKKYVLDFECVSTCYNKYLFAQKTIFETIVEQGRIVQSDYVVNSEGAYARDRFFDAAFPIGGHEMPGHETIPRFRKFYEAYQFSPPRTSGR